MRARFDRMHFLMIGTFDCSQCVALVSRLSTALLPARFAQTARAWLSQPITGRWLAAVATILGNLIFQCLDSVNQFTEGLFKQSNDRLFALLVGRVYLFSGRQWYLAHTDIVAGLYDFASRLSLSEAEQLPQIQVIVSFGL